MLPRIGLLRWRSPKFQIACAIALGLLLEVLFHQFYYYVPRPYEDLDPVFQVGCREPNTTAPRENAAIIMLARNEDLGSAISSLQSLEDHFNRWFHYTVIFMNDEPFSAEFQDGVSKVVSGETKFEVIGKDLFGYPSWMDEATGRELVKANGDLGVHKGSMESYHHMCRFYSGKFYDVPALKGYRYYWRVEPHVQFSCAVTYDPFRLMREKKKKYGYTIALWELDNTVPDLFRVVSEFKAARRIRDTSLWKAFIRPSWMPWGLRWLKAGQSLHDAKGDSWNLCHFWSNFEIGDLDFFRSQEHRDFFEYLDSRGGFYAERWGDASVHAFAAALLLKPEELHHFEDFGYYHDPWVVAPANALGKQLENSEVLGPLGEHVVEGEEGGTGCRCERKQVRNFQNYCINKVQKSTRPTAWPNKMWVEKKKEEQVAVSGEKSEG
ncbi:glycolipid 2-alpha-mannosyltransferase [Bimuria novae-zelandiae CBS 107.79]|uniref:Glycolipid 2-alpha-mannosyltransferase n=1 Tax=Bimuria novae-zelandiae CBS 107.79 TaxID=1447943 RepID=A0A6A5UUL3_9PLEO|nr:glycolipid 2-alpha-mannosyltransferase [Bimuria novae-zelandiae CBS 107.79]